MNKTPKLFILAGAVLASLFLFVSIVYNNFVQKSIYEENSRHLLSTYEQVDKTFTMFVQYNWNALSDWSNNLQYLDDTENMKTLWYEFTRRKDAWQYQDFYMFNENCDFITAAGRDGNAPNIQGIFLDMYATGQPVISSYIASDSNRRIVFALPMDVPYTINGVTYSGLAVSYNNDVVEKLIAGNIYQGQSDCYILTSDGNVLLSLEPKTEFLQKISNLFDFLNKYTDMTENEITDLKKNIKNVSTGSLQCRYNNKNYYLVYEPTGINDWTVVGIIHDDVVDASMRRIQSITIVLLLILNGCIALLLTGTVFALMDSRLRMKEHEQMILLKRKELTEQMFSGLGRIVDRFAVGDLKNNRYEYHENLLKHPIYPETGYYDDLVEDISRQYLVMTDTENKKMNHLLTPDYLRCVLKKKDDIFKIEYYNRSIDTYLVMHVVPVEWGSEHELEKVMLIAQDIGQKHELENLANTDGLTGLFNERYFNSILHKKELQKLPFILFYLDLDHFKPVNDTYGHDMGDKLLKEEAEKRLQAIREFTELGSGIKIAMRDLEIRGAGNVLGAEQHGHMEAVGYDLYCKMLNQAVLALKGEETEEESYATSVECDIDAYIPAAYIKNEYQKLDIYKRISAIETEDEYMDMQDELLDRFGDIPKSVENLLVIARVRALAQKAKINVGGIPDLVNSYGGALKLVPGEVPVFHYVERKPKGITIEDMLFKAEEILKGLRKLRM